MLNSPHHFLLHKVIQLFILFCSQKPFTIRGQIIPAEVASIVNSDDNNYNETNILFPCRDWNKHFRNSPLFQSNHLNWLWQVKVNASSSLNSVYSSLLPVLTRYLRNLGGESTQQAELTKNIARIFVTESDTNYIEWVIICWAINAIKRHMQCYAGTQQV